MTSVLEYSSVLEYFIDENVKTYEEPVKNKNHLGFTGTKYGLSHKQMAGVINFLTYHRFNVLHHGCCIGADYQVALIAKGLDFTVIGHPPINEKFMMGEMYLNDVTRKPKTYLERDLNIITESAYLLATPKTMKKVPRSGTWTTIEYAKSAKLPYTIIYPDGTGYGSSG
jgi:hypothetical protein